MRTTTRLSALLTLALSTAAVSAADLSLTYSAGNAFAFPASTVVPPANPTGSILEGEVHFLVGTLVNTSNSTLYVDGIASYSVYNSSGMLPTWQNGAYICGPSAATDIFSFAFNAAGIAPGASYTGNIGYIIIDSTTPDGRYDHDGSGGTALAGVIQFSYYLTPDKTGPSQLFNGPNISVTIGAIPEPAGLSALVPAFILATARTRRTPR